MPAPAPAVDQQVIWKNDEVGRFCVALVRAALRLSERGTFKFTTDIVAEAERGAGTGIAGTVVTMLKNAHVIEPVGFMRDGKFYAERAMSAREGRKSAWNNVYRLTTHGAAKAFLARQGQPVALEQLEMYGNEKGNDDARGN